MCVSSGNLRPAGDPSTKRSPKAAHSPRAAPHPCWFQLIKRVLSRSPANPVFPPTLSPKVTPSYTGEHRQGHLTPLFSRQHLAPKTTSACCLSLSAAKEAYLWAHVQDLIALFQAPGGLETPEESKGSGSRVSQRVGRAASCGKGSARQCPGHIFLLGVSPAGSWAPAVLHVQRMGYVVVLNSTVHTTGVCFLNTFPPNSL